MTKCSHVSVGGREVIECSADADPSIGWSDAAGNDPARNPANVCVGGSAERVESWPRGVYNRFAGAAGDYIAGRPLCAGGEHAVIQGLIEVAKSNSRERRRAADELYEIARARPELAIECINGLGEAAGTNYAAAYQLRDLVSVRPELASMIIRKLSHAAIWNNVLALQSLEWIAVLHPELALDVEKELNSILDIVSQASGEENRRIAENINSSLVYIRGLKNNSPAGAGGKETIW